MFRYLKLALVLYFLMGLVYSLGFGYFLSNTTQRIGSQSYYDQIQNIVSANYQNSGLEICLSGQLAVSGENQFSLLIPLDKIKISTPGKNPNGWELSGFDYRVTLSRQYVYKGCQSGGISTRNPVGVEKVELKQNSSIVASGDLENIIKSTSVDLLVNEVSVINENLTIDKNKKILLIGATPIVRDSRYLYIDIESKKANGSFFWWFVVPLAAVADAMTFPYQIYKWFVYAGSH